MKTASLAGFDPIIVLAFIREHTTETDIHPSNNGGGRGGRDGARNSNRIITLINGIPRADGHEQMLERWRHWDVVPLGRLDSFLMRYGLMLSDYEHWAETTPGPDGEPRFGWNGWYEPSN